MGIDYTYSGIKKIKEDFLKFPLLYSDIQKGLIFPIIKENEIFFLHHKKTVFTYTLSEKFKICATFIDKNNLRKEQENTYITEDEYIFFTNKTFNDNYEKIISLNSSDDKQYLETYKKYSYVKKNQKEKNLIINLAIPTEDNLNYPQSADLLLFNTKNLHLYYAELRSITDSDLTHPLEKPSIIGKIYFLNNKIKNNYDIILQNAINQIKTTNRLFGTKNPIPKFLNQHVTVLLLDFKPNCPASELTANNLYKLYREGIEVFAFKGS